MPAPRSAPWECPQCGRTVPARENRCHCGVLRSESPAVPRATDTASASRSFGRIVLVLGFVAAAAFAFHTAALPPRRPPAEAPSPPPLRESGPPETAPRAFAPSPYTPPVGALSFPSTRPEPPPSTLKARPAPADEASPSPTSMEEAWTRAIDLLESPLQKIAAETAELQQQSAPFAYTCLGSPPGSWLSALKSAPVKTGVPYSKFGVTVDCEFARRELVARGNVIKAELEAAERLAHSSRVLPGHWRKLVETHQLEIWDSF
jgi:hypothetical protein